MQDIKVVVKELGKTGGLECVNIYITNVPTYYASVHEAKLKFNSKTEKEYQATVFVDEATKDELLDKVMLNKTFALVGKDKTTKPPRRIKYPLSSQVEEGKHHYDNVEGMYGFSLAKPEFSKKGKKMSVNVIDKDGKEFNENVGNGSICTFKLFGYRNQDNQVVVTIDTVQVVEHVPYEGGGAGSGVVVDDVLGVSYAVKQVEEVSKKEEKFLEDAFDEDSELPF